MRLLYITNGITGSGGLERVLSVKASMLAEENGYDVHILSLNEKNIKPFFSFSNQIQFYSIEVGGNPLRYFLTYKHGIQKVVKKVLPDIVLVCDDGLKGFFLPKLINTNAKWIYERHVSKLIENQSATSSIFSFLKIKAKWFLMDKFAKSFDKFVVLTKGNKMEWPNLQNLIIIANPLSFISKEVAALENKVVLCVGKISFQKGQDILVRAWDKISFAYPDWELHLYGKENRSFLDTKKLPLNIKYFSPEKNIQNIYLHSSVYVMSSRYEGFGMVLIEAMECGVPCVAFDCNYGPGDVITNKEDGLLVEKENVKELSDKLLFLIENDNLRKEMGAKAKKNVQRFSADEIVQQWDALFRSLG